MTGPTPTLLNARPPRTSLTVWMVETGEPVAGLDAGARDHRYGMLARALLDRGHEVVWWNSTFLHRTKRYRCQSPTSLELRPGLTLRLLHGRPGYRRNVSLARWLHHRAMARQFSEAVTDEAPPDVIVACLPTLELCEAAVLFGQRWQVPVIVDIQDPWPDIYLGVLPDRLHGLARRLLAPEYRRLTRLLAGAACVTAVSDAYLTWGRARGASASDSRRAFPLGYPEGVVAGADGAFPSPEVVKARYGIPATSHLVVFSGSFGRSCDLDTIADCAELMHREGRADVHFALAGGGDRMSWMRRRASSLPNVRLTGWLEQQSLLELLRSASVGLAAYGPRATQTLPYKPFEYMASGLPQVSSLRGDLEGFIRTYGIGRQYKGGDARSLRAAILTILEATPAARDQMGRNACALFRDRFDARRIYPEMAAFVESFAGASAKVRASG